MPIETSKQSCGKQRLIKRKQRLDFCKNIGNSKKKSSSSKNKFNRYPNQRDFANDDLVKLQNSAGSGYLSNKNSSSSYNEERKSGNNMNNYKNLYDFIQNKGSSQKDGMVRESSRYHSNIPKIQEGGYENQPSKTIYKKSKRSETFDKQYQNSQI